MMRSFVGASHSIATRGVKHVLDRTKMTTTVVGSLAHSEHVVEPEGSAKVFVPGAPRRVVSCASGVHHSEAARV